MAERPTTVPTYGCELCGDWVEVKPDGRGFPPDIAKRKLFNSCANKGCRCEPKYRAGLIQGGRATGQGA